MRRHRTRYLGMAAASLILGGSAVPSASAQDAVAGGKLAQTWCANCHVVGRTQASGTSTGAPSFSSIAQRKDLTPMALRVFLQTPHDRMPDLHLSRDEVDDVIAYIGSLQKTPS